MTEHEIEMMYLEKEQQDIKNWCKKNGFYVKYKGENYYLYDKAVYNENMEIVIEYAENGFLDLYKYYEEKKMFEYNGEFGEKGK